ncbi:MAG: hypothetical protein SRB2_02412 [Desulfobacteraceae bacterium Eth-SRB2]|nr:MAG: hypothetical protein SRB2_02412 [Desulfobacteraceae bacterium Eth-SRB2]
MKKHKLMIIGVLGLLAWFAIGPGFALAQGEVILPEPSNNNSNSVTISIIDIEENDVTGTWLPNPDEHVQIVINNVLAGYNITLDQTQTSAYPGQCTNFDNPSGNAIELDFKFNSYNNILTPTDSGGMAVSTSPEATLAVTPSKTSTSYPQTRIKTESPTTTRRNIVLT